MGRRATAINDGHLSPILKRWIAATITPVAELLRFVATAYVAGDMEACAKVLDTPLFGMTTWGSDRTRPLMPLMQWLLRGESVGRGVETTYAEDLVLTGLGVAISKCAGTRHSSDGSGVTAGFTVNAILDAMAQALAETVTGQFLVSVQGAEAMRRVREDAGSNVWSQGRSLSRIVGMMRSQIKPQLLEQEKDNPELGVKGKRVLQIITQDGDLRRISLKRTPDMVDWQVLLLSWEGDDKATRARNRPLWLALALLILSAAQRTSGWFDLTTRAQHNPRLSALKDRGSKKHRSKTKVLVLSDRAAEAIHKDIDHWVTAGFCLEPMIVQPDNGDYLSVKHRPVGGRPGPKGMVTDPTTCLMATEAAKVLSDSRWQVNRLMLAWLRDNDQALGPAREAMGETAVAMTMEAHRKDAVEDSLYLPSVMDFRGRMYYRPTWVNPQQGSLNKALLQFPPTPETMGRSRAHGMEALMLHCSTLGGMDKMDKGTRWRWFEHWTNEGCGYRPDADEPLILQSIGLLINAGLWDQAPVQLDGTCNGLQHLSALFRDLPGAESVNLTKGGLQARDIYGEVADKLTQRFERLIGPHPMIREALTPGAVPGWLYRFALSGVYFDRKVTKRPVMVLPFGGQLATVQEALKASLLERLGDKAWIWQTGAQPDAIEGNYAAFKTRELLHHPLFNKDCQRLGQLLWECITEAIPRPMEAMKVFSAIGSKVGERGLEWETPSGLWVMQAKSKADRKQVAMRGFHLPNSIRRLTLLAERNEVDARYHRTGIVANYIHSLDAAHLASVLEGWRATQGEPIGAIHDCVLVRPSMAENLGWRLRSSFERMYHHDPLSLPVSIVSATSAADPKGPTLEFESWYELATMAGVQFPSWGSWQPSQVLESEYFFS